MNLRDLAPRSKHSCKSSLQRETLVDLQGRICPHSNRSIWRGNTIQRDFPSRRCVEPLRAFVRFYEPLFPRARAGPPDVSQREPAATFESKREYRFGSCPGACGPTSLECSECLRRLRASRLPWYAERYGTHRSW